MDNGKKTDTPVNSLQVHPSSSYYLALKSPFRPKESISNKSKIKTEYEETVTHLPSEDNSSLPCIVGVHFEGEKKRHIKVTASPPQHLGKSRSLLKYSDFVKDIPTHPSRNLAERATQSSHSSGSLPQHQTNSKDFPLRVDPSVGVIQHLNSLPTSAEHHARNLSEQIDFSENDPQLLNSLEDVTKHQNPPGNYGDILPSNSSILSDEVCCRICQEDDTIEKLVSPCYCSGTVGSVHMSCLETWLKLTCRTECELCLYPFPVEKIHPSVWQHLKHPTKNMDFSSLLCDIACFFVLTPLLVASTYLCSIGATHYDEAGKTESMFAIITLMCSLVAVYISWAILAILYHYRVWCSWREAKAEIHMWKEAVPLTSVGKQSANLKEENRTEHGRFDENRRSGTSILLRPILRYSGSIKTKSRNAVANISTHMNNVPAHGLLDHAEGCFCIVGAPERVEIFRASNDQESAHSPHLNVKPLKSPSESLV